MTENIVIVDEHQLQAYALGYYHGRATGTERNPFDGMDARRGYYTLGYDKGVADYCSENVEE